MSWHYQATRRAIPDRVREVYEVREVYVGKDSGRLTWTEDAIAANSDTKEGLIEVLQMMLRDVQEFDVLEVEE